jgi:hypothetical protein
MWNDVGENGSPDIAIGVHESDQVVVLRSRTLVGWFNNKGRNVEEHKQKVCAGKMGNKSVRTGKTGLKRGKPWSNVIQ